MEKKRMTIDEFRKMQDSQKPRKKQRHREHDLQVSFVRWFNYHHPELRGRLFAVPNMGHRSKLTGRLFKEEGMVAGVSDLIFLKRNKHFGALLIETKTDKGKQSESQKIWQENVCKDNEFKYVICRSLDDFIKEIESFLAD